MLTLNFNVTTKVLITCRFNDKMWVTTFWFLQNIKHHNHATFMNQKVVTQNLNPQVISTLGLIVAVAAFTAAAVVAEFFGDTSDSVFFIFLITC